MAPRILATGTLFDEYPDAEEALAERELRWRLSIEERGERERARAGELLFVRARAFVEFDDGTSEQRWEGTPQGPFAVPLGGSATSALLGLAGQDPESLDGDLSIAGLRVSRFAYHAAPRRIDVEPALARRLTLD